jgi:2-oxoglutarate dehydrogenase E1 component
MSKNLQEQYAQSPLFGANANAVETLYGEYLRNPDAVPPSWRSYFESLGDNDTEMQHAKIREQLRNEAKAGRRSARQGPTAAVSGDEKQAAVSRLIQVYSLRGHQIADIDPLGLMHRPVPGVLKRDYLGLTDADMDAEFFTGGLAGSGNRRMKLKDFVALL